MVFQTKIVNEEDFNNVVYNSPGMIQVIEVHQKWCGPSKPIVSSLQRLYFELDSVPLKFYTACANDIESLSDLVGDCKPLFLFFKDGETFYEIEGLSLQLFTDKLEELAKEYNRDAAPKTRVETQVGMPSAA